MQKVADIGVARGGPGPPPPNQNTTNDKKL